MRILIKLAGQYDDSPFFQALEADEAPFFQELERAIREEFDSPFFNELDEEIKREQEQAFWLSKRASHRARYAREALRILKRLRRVESISLHHLARGVPEDFFGNLDARFAAVKTLHEKKACLIWHLQGLYHYYAFAERNYHKWDIRRGLGYTKQRKYFARLLAQHKEGIEERRKQVKWDTKRERVRNRRQKLKEQMDHVRHKNRTHWNGALFVDPYVKEGGWAILDDGYSHAKSVYVHNLGKYFARVSNQPRTPLFGVSVVRLTRKENGWD